MQGIKSRGVVRNVPELAVSASEGLAVARTEVDSLVRRLPLLLQTPDGWTPSFGIEVMKILSSSDTYIIRGEQASIVELTLPNYAQIPVDQLGRRWVSWIDTPSTTLQEMDVKDKFVFVGVTQRGSCHK